MMGIWWGYYGLVDRQFHGDTWCVATHEMFGKPQLLLFEAGSPPSSLQNLWQKEPVTWRRQQPFRMSRGRGHDKTWQIEIDLYRHTKLKFNLLAQSFEVQVLKSYVSCLQVVCFVLLYTRRVSICICKMRGSCLMCSRGACNSSMKEPENVFLHGLQTVKRFCHWKIEQLMETLLVW